MNHSKFMLWIEQLILAQIAVMILVHMIKELPAKADVLLAHDTHLPQLEQYLRAENIRIWYMDIRILMHILHTT